MRETMSGRRTRRPDGGANLYSLPVSYAAVDTETTGLDFDFCDIIEIGAVRVEDGEIADAFDSLVNIGYEVGSFITELTGITDKMLEEAPRLNDVISKFEAFAGDSVLLAHNASFDMNFLYAAYEKVLGKPMKNDYVDTLRVARKALPDMKHHGLADICKALGISNEQEHRAASDAIAAHECYKLMRPMVLERFGDEQGYKRSFHNSGNQRRARDIVATVADIDEDNPLYGMRCVFTGKMTSMTREEVQQTLANVGGIPQDNVRKDTDYLIIGNDGFRESLHNTSSKIKKAQANQLKGLPVQIISEDAFLSLLDE